MSQYHFLIPDPVSFPSGGNVFNKQLMQALIRAGVHVSHDCFQPEVLFDSPNTVYILDSIYFGQIEDPALQIPRRCIGLIHHLNSLYPISDSYYLEKETPILNALSGYIATSTFTKNYLVGHGRDPEWIEVVEPAPMILRPAIRSASREVNALMLGSYVPRKGLLPFLEALAQADIPLQYTLTVAGNTRIDTAYADACHKVVSGNSALSSCIELLGEQEATTIQHLYESANLFISASQMETFGMAIQDAVFSGLPVLALEGGYAAEHINDGVNGTRCSTVEELVQAFAQCLTDPDAFVLLQQRAMEFTPNYHTWDEGADTLLSAWPPRL